MRISAVMGCSWDLEMSASNLTNLEAPSTRVTLLIFDWLLKFVGLELAVELNA